MTKTATENPLLLQLREWDACADGYEFSVRSGATTLAQLWDKLERPDWMLWLADKKGLKLDEKGLRLFACECAEQLLPIYEKAYPKDDRPRRAIETARRYANGEATLEELDAARDAAEDAAWDAARAAAEAPAWASAWAAARDAAEAAAWAAAWAAARDAAEAAAWASAWDAAEAAARAAARAKQADLLRKHLGNPFEEVKP